MRNLLTICVGVYVTTVLEIARQKSLLGVFFMVLNPTTEAPRTIFQPNTSIHAVSRSGVPFRGLKAQL